jgi:micrococcal nuclease
VVEVLDGDTIKVAIAGEVRIVRYIGVDCPERRHPEQPAVWMEREATEANRALIQGETVLLEKDVSETDAYGRLLCYVFATDGTFINAELVRRGYAKAVSYPPDVKYESHFQTLEQEARAAGRGIWGPTPTPSPYPTPAPSTVTIVNVDKRAEFVEIRNTGEEPQNLEGWTLISERGYQICPLAGELGPGQTLRIWALAADSGSGYSCGFESNIWNNSESDPAVLTNAQGLEVSRYP